MILANKVYIFNLFYPRISLRSMKGERMGKKDTVSKKIERNNDVFADIFNTLLFKKEVIQSQKLKPGVTNVLVETKKGDKSLGLENQTEKDNLMPVRVMGYDYGEYLGQISNVGSVKLPYLYPSITLVLNFSDTRWEKPESLKECIRYNEVLWPYISDYKMHVVDMNFLTDEEIGNFKSDLRGIFTLLKDIREGKFEPTKYDFCFKHPDDAYKFISVYLQDDRLEEVIHNAEKKERKGTTMCEAFDKLINEGIERGIERGIKQGIKTGREEGRISMLKQLIDSGTITTEIAAEQMGVTGEKLKVMMADVE